MNKLVFFLFCLLVSGSYVQAEECRGIIKGTLTGDDGYSLSGAYVYVAEDNQNITTGTTSGDNGTFELEVPCGSLVLGISCLGYEMKKLEVSVIDGKACDLGIIALAPSSLELQTVVVKGLSVKVKSLSDGFSVNVATLAKSSNNALDLLGRLPQIAVKGNEIKVIGKEQIILKINNVLQRVDAGQLADVLRAYDAGLIKSVDVITSPPLKYDSDGTAAMIVLHMDSKFNKYTGGNIGTELMKGAEYNGRYGVYGSGVFNNDKLFFELTPSFNHNYSHMSENTVYDFGDNKYRNYTPSDGYNNYVGGHGTVQYQYNKKGYFGLSFNVNKKAIRNNFISEEYRSDVTIDDLNKIGIDRPRFNISLYAEHSFSPALKLWLESTYYNYKDDNDKFLESFEAGNTNPFMTYQSDERLKVQGVTLANDYSLKLSEDGSFTLDFGLKAYYTDTRNGRFDHTEYIASSVVSQNDDIHLREYKAAPYVSSTWRSSQKINFRLGAKVIYTNRHVESGTASDKNIEYTSFLPDFIASWTSGKGNRLSLIVTSSSIEPKFNQINPFAWRVNQWSYSQGNMDIKCENRYNYKLVYADRNGFSASVYVNHKLNQISSVSKIVEDKVYSVMENAQNSIELGIRPSYYFDRLEWFEFSVEGYWAYGISKGKIPGIAKKTTSNLWGANLYTGFVFNRSRTFTGYISLDYTGYQKNAISSINPICDLGAGISIFMLKRKMCVSIAGMSLLPVKYKGISRYDGYTMNFNNRFDYPTLYFSLTYKFNNIKDASPRKKKMIQDIERRM